MMTRGWIGFVLSAALSLSAWAAAVPMFQARPSAVFAHEPTTILLEARVESEPGRVPSQVRALRLQGAGNEKPACEMANNGSRGDAAKNDKIYTCTISLKEPMEGLVSFTAEALYPDSLVPVRSRAIFVKVTAGMTSKEKKEIHKIEQHASALYRRMTKERGLIQAQRETIAWLHTQEGVIGVTPISARALYIQFDTGAGLILPGPPPEN